MSHVSESAIKKLPKQPLNAYFKFRGDRLAELADEPDRVSKVKREWDALPEKDKKEMEDEYKDALEQYKKDVDEWKTKHDIDDSDWKLVKDRVKALKKGDKSKGSKAAPKEEKKERSKSKDNKADKNDKQDKKVEVTKEKPKEDKKGAKSKGK
jgi:hypothetical protein